MDGRLVAFLEEPRDKERSQNGNKSPSDILNERFCSGRTLFFSSFCFCLSSRTARRFSALSRWSSSFLRRSSSCCSRSCRAFSSFSSHWFFFAAEVGENKRGETSVLPLRPGCRKTFSLVTVDLTYNEEMMMMMMRMMTMMWNKH